MPVVRYTVACLVALTFFGASHAFADLPPIKGKASKPVLATLVVEVCFGEACGPKIKPLSGEQIGDSFPPIAKQAGTVTASGPISFTCPGPCWGSETRPVKVTLRAVARRGGNTRFDHWERACARAGTVASCTVRVDGQTPVKAVFVRRY